MEDKREKRGGKREISLPEGVEVEIKDDKIVIKGERGQLEKRLKADVKIRKDNNSLILTTTSERRRIKALLGTTNSEIKNMIRGVKEGVTYKLKVVYSHFPVNLKIQGDIVWIENFLGEKYPRKATILEGVKVDIKGQEIEVGGIDKEMVRQTAANIEQATKIRKRDRRVFQDGCYIYEKDGKSLLKR